MSTSAPFLSPGLPVWPAELSASQRGGLVVFVALCHVLVAMAVLSRAIKPVTIEERAPIEVSLIRDALSAAEVRQAVPAPLPQHKAMPSEPVRPKPVPASQGDERPSAKQSTILTSPHAQSTLAVQAQAAVTPTPMPLPPARALVTPAVAPPVTAPTTAPTTATTTATTSTPLAAQATAPSPGAESARPSATPVDLPSSALRYLIEPKLNYPRVSRELGESGMVQLRVQIDEQGHPRQIQLAKSSGFPRLDQEAMRAMNAARFQPRIVDGVPRAVTTTATLGFDLDEQ